MEGESNRRLSEFPWPCVIPPDTRSLSLLEAGMAGKPGVEASQCAFAKRKRSVARVFDLGYRGSPNAGEDAQLRAVELTMRKFCRQKD